MQASSEPLRIDPLLARDLDDLVATGRFVSREDAVRHAVRLIWDAEYDTRLPEPLDAETMAILEERIAEADANPDGGIPAEEVFAELRQRYQNWK